MTSAGYVELIGGKVAFWRWALAGRMDTIVESYVIYEYLINVTGRSRRVTMQQLNNTIYIYQVSFRYGKFSCGYLKFLLFL